MSATIIKEPKKKVDPSILRALQAQTQEVGQVVLHFIMGPKNFFMGVTKIRIWPTTYLFDRDSDHRSELVHFENINLYPDWGICMYGVNNYFTLIFSGLPKNCTVFDFIEICDQQGGEFKVLNIKRNSSDVYYLSL